MSSFYKGLMFTTIPIVVLSTIGWFGFLFEPLYWASNLAIVYCLVTLILALIFHFDTGERRLARGMFVGICIGAVAVAINIWWHLHSIGWT